MKYLVPFCCLALSLSGCSKDSSLDASSYEITFGARMTEMTKAGIYSATDLNSLGQFVATGYDGDTKQIDAVTVEKTSASVWKFSGGPKLWTAGHNMTFWASANLETGFSVTTSANTSATFGVTSIAAASASQSDPLIGYYSGSGSAGKATITFYHPLTAVRFEKGASGDPAKITSINSVNIVGVYASGTATVTGGTPLSYNWTSKSGSQTVTGSFSGTASAAPYILIPQDLATKNVTLQINATHTDKGNITMTVTLDSGSWAAGYLNTYTLDYVNDKMTATLTVSLTPWGTVMNTYPDPDIDYFNAVFE